MYKITSLVNRTLMSLPELPEGNVIVALKKNEYIKNRRIIMAKIILIFL